MATPTEVKAVAEEDALRGRFYALLSNLLSAPPGAETLERLIGLEADETEIGEALGRLADAASRLTPDAVDDEYNALFIGLSRGEIVPYGSFYLTGFLFEKPLAELRSDLARLGVERVPGRAEPEDQIGFLCEVMHGLILGEFGDGSIKPQHDFFRTHVASWAETFFRDLEAAKSADFYRPVGTIGRLFLAVEREAMAMLGEKTPG